MTAPDARDRGLQAERTALSTIAIAALFLHQAAERGWGLATTPALFASCTMLVTAGVCYCRGRGLHVGNLGVGRHAAAIISVAVVASALTTIAVEIWV